jgi:2-polyprenyl-6-hydroxyphenyl methylase/3-demethylubiquinone-9 3-methyltransferase
MAHAWWDDSVGVFSSLRFFVNPVRFAYFRRILATEASRQALRSALDVGCGGGILSEDVARLGLAVTGVDPSAETIAAARRHAVTSGLAIDYRVASGEALPFGDAAFEVVLCCDVLEHVDAVGPVLAEIARVLRPGGLLFFDTINRTFVAKLAVIKLMQEWPSTAFVPRDVHHYRKFIKPGELRAALSRVGLVQRGIRGMMPAAGLLACLRAYRAQARGEIDFRQLGERLRFGESRHTEVSYMGWAVKEG